MGNAGTVGKLLAAGIAVELTGNVIKKSRELSRPIKKKRRKGMRIP